MSVIQPHILVFKLPELRFILLTCSLPYWSFFGGVFALTPEHYMKMNGFPNTYWDRGGEHDDIAERYYPGLAGRGALKNIRLYFIPNQMQ